MSNVAQKKPLLIFDFDGVICDSFLTVLSTLSELSKVHDYKDPFGLDLEYHHLSTKEILSLLEISSDKVPIVMADMLKIFELRMKELPLCKGLKEMIILLKDNGYKMGIVSSNSESNILSFLRHHNINVFDFVHSSMLFNKHEVLFKILNDLNINTNSTYYIGDEARDIEAAKAVGIKSIAVSWGYQAEDVLIKYAPEHLFTSPQELLSFFQIQDRCS